MVHMTIGHNAGKCHPRRRQKKSQHRCPAIGVAYRESGEGLVSWDATDSTRTLHTEEIVQAYWGLARITSAVPHRFSHRGRAGSMSTSSANPLMVKIDISRGWAMRSMRSARANNTLTAALSRYSPALGSPLSVSRPLPSSEVALVRAWLKASTLLRSISPAAARTSFPSARRAVSRVRDVGIRGSLRIGALGY